MSDIGFHRPNQAKLFSLGVESLLQRFDLDGVTEEGSCAVGFHVADAVRLHSCCLERGIDNTHLALHTRGCKPRFAVPIIVDG